MMGSVPPATPETVDKMYALLAIVADPVKAKATLAELQAAQQAADDRLAAASAASAGLDARESAIAAREQAADAKLAKANSIRDEAQTLQTDAKQRLDRIQEIGRSLNTMSDS